MQSGITRLSPALIAAIVALISAVTVTAIADVQPASAAKGKKKRDGTYSGRALHPLFTEDGDPYDTFFSVGVLKGRVSAIVAEARMQCSGAEVYDVKYVKHRIQKRKRPKLSSGGGFHISGNGIDVSGRIGKRVAEGTISAVGHGCSAGNATWTAEKEDFDTISPFD
jgi:hypothetical protein